jgi:hypothetical protein
VIFIECFMLIVVGLVDLMVFLELFDGIWW